MHRHGQVKKCSGDYIEVSLLRHSACSQCGGCALGKSESQEQIVLALNKANAKIGDYVQLILPEGNIASAALLAYGLPLVALLIALLIGAELGLADVKIMLFAFLSLVGSYAISRFILEPRRKNMQKYKVVAIKIIDKDELEEVEN